MNSVNVAESPRTFLAESVGGLGIRRYLSLTREKGTAVLCASQIEQARFEAVMLLVYGDESLDGTQSRVCAVAGVIGTEEMWRELEPKWIERNGGITFHADSSE